VDGPIGFLSRTCESKSWTLFAGGEEMELRRHGGNGKESSLSLPFRGVVFFFFLGGEVRDSHSRDYEDYCLLV
jgi:hypothetical protein